MNEWGGKMGRGIGTGGEWGDGRAGKRGVQGLPGPASLPWGISVPQNCGPAAPWPPTWLCCDPLPHGP